MSRYNGSIITFTLGLTVSAILAMSVKYSSALPTLSLIAGVCALLTACGTLNDTTRRMGSIVTPYKIEVVQGNFVSKEQVEALRPGMSRAQIKDILGTPLVASAFHGDRWDYVFSIRRQGLADQNRKLTVYFKGDLFDKVEGDAMPSEAEFVASLDTGRKLGKVPLLEVPEEVLREFSLKNTSAAQILATNATNNAQAAPNLGATTINFPPLEAPGTRVSAWDASTQRTLANAPAAAAPAAPRASASVNAPLLVAAAPAPAPASTAPPVTAPVAAVAVPAPVTSRAAPTSATAPTSGAVTAPFAAPATTLVPVPVPVPAPAP